MQHVGRDGGAGGVAARLQQALQRRARVRLKAYPRLSRTPWSAGRRPESRDACAGRVRGAGCRRSRRRWRRRASASMAGVGDALVPVGGKVIGAQGVDGDDDDGRVPPARAGRPTGGAAARGARAGGEQDRLVRLISPLGETSAGAGESSPTGGLSRELTSETESDREVERARADRVPSTGTTRIVCRAGRRGRSGALHELRGQAVGVHRPVLVGLDGRVEPADAAPSVLLLNRFRMSNFTYGTQLAEHLDVVGGGEVEQCAPANSPTPRSPKNTFRVGPGGCA